LERDCRSAGDRLLVALGELALDQLLRVLGVGVGQSLGLGLTVGADPPEANGDGLVAGGNLSELGRASLDELEMAFHAELQCEWTV
jgi:hypothetical protein